MSNPLKAYLKKGRLEAGCDEAGRGCLAGPVYAAAVILQPGFDHPLLRDSKALSAAERLEVKSVIEREATAWAVAFVTPEEIDRINILQASFLAMHRAVKGLTQVPAHLLIDGNRFKTYPGIAHTCIVKGDAHYRSIAAASILAKTHRDLFMEELHARFPDYGWLTNKGYPTVAHRSAIREVGLSNWHRKSFKLLPQELPFPSDSR